MSQLFSNKQPSSTTGRTISIYISFCTIPTESISSNLHCRMKSDLRVQKAKEIEGQYKVSVTNLKDKFGKSNQIIFEE